MDDLNELACISAYAKYLNLSDSAVQRAEDKFPELVGQPRWDYALNCENDVWDSAEIKSIVVPESLREFSGWSDIWRAVEDKLAGHVAGSFLVIGNPEWFPTQSERTKLVAAIATAVEKHIEDWPEGFTRDLSDDVAAEFPDWPKDIPHTEMVGEPGKTGTEIKVVYPPIKLTVWRTSSEGKFSLGYGSGRAIGFTPGVRLLEFIDTLKKADSQLAIAKRLGARSGVILLDDHRATKPSEIREAFSGISSSDLPNTDAIFLVKTSASVVEKVWKSSTFAKGRKMFIVGAIISAAIVAWVMSPDA